MSTWARPGVKCVCVYAEPDQGKYWREGERPAVGAVYVVTTHPFVKPSSGNLVVRLAGHPVPLRLSRFRPLVTRTQEQDVALFRQIIADAPAGVDA